MAFDIGNMLQQYLGGNQPADAGQVEQHFDEATQQVPRESVGSGIAEAFRSDRTPPFGQMVGQLFGNGDSQQRAGMLNQLIGSLGPGVLGALGGMLGGGGGGASGPGGLGGLAGMLGGGGNGGGNGVPRITPEQASQIDPAQVQQIAEQAQNQDPSVIDRMGNFYAAHPTLVKSLGSAALAIVMGKMAQQRNG